MEQHGFKAEVQQLLDLMIHSVYSNRDVFLRELVSNAADALDKVRFVELTEGGLVGAAGDPGVRITIDKDARTITIEDDGVGMSRDEAIQNLGTIAHSGSRQFFEQLKREGASGAPDLIGRFGVGFYSCFMVAERVVVESQSAWREKGGVRWISAGAGTFEVEEFDRLTRGTRIVLTVREDADEYLDVWKVRSIIRTHSNFLAWPIVVDGQQANSGKALWHEPPASVTDEAANELYRSLAMDWEEPIARVHFTVDTPLQLAAMLFIPANRPYDLFVPEADRGPRLYARRVLIEEHARHLVPDWLRFLRGVVDSEDIPLNVSREMVQKTPAVRKIQSMLTKRVLKELKKLAESEPAEGEAHPYERFWKAFGLLIKEGYYHDKATYGDELLPLLRFNTTAHADEAGLTSLAAYKAAMPEGQDTIWFITAESRAAALSSPHLEAFRKRGWAVLLLTDAVDEWFVQGLDVFDGTPVKSVARGDLKLDDEAEGDKADLAGLAPWMHGLFVDEVASVRESHRLTDSPAVLVDEDDGMSANMERILRSARQDVQAAKRHLELNVRHPLIRDLVTLHEKGRLDVAEPIARLLLDDALLLEGTVRDAAAVGRRLQGLLERAAASAAQA
ncbi:MAG TPA: molecular chaperone HtpG [Myxococcota bacterium]|nr:molecular chaperone HtpG [Myxococcota bacterium]